MFKWKTKKRLDFFVKEGYKKSLRPSLLTHESTTHLAQYIIYNNMKVLKKGEVWLIITWYVMPNNILLMAGHLPTLLYPLFFIQYIFSNIQISTTLGILYRIQTYDFEIKHKFFSSKDCHCNQLAPKMFTFCGIISVLGRFITQTADKFLRPLEMGLFKPFFLVLFKLQASGNRNFSIWFDF